MPSRNAAARSKALFKEAPAQARATKADKTTEAARALAEAESRERTVKTEKLRALRLEKEAADAKAAEKAAAAKKKPAPKKKAMTEETETA
ncbi:MAG: hypothetical protein CVT81_13040 [Alphaproteobacteria bacterium HGW-Alphaproteobacteria-3]|nr:MAG: hypothetical protein CVT81_13040 [Alphaproteobacteria bacterium HGW-Alphaproteobacteria-3]